MKRALPTRGRTLPTRDRTLPTRDRTLPTRDRTLPTRDRTLPTRDRTLPTRDRTLPTRDRTLPTRDRTLPTRDRSLPIRDRALPSRDRKEADKGNRSLTVAALKDGEGFRRQRVRSLTVAALKDAAHEVTGRKGVGRKDAAHEGTGRKGAGQKVDGHKAAAPKGASPPDDRRYPKRPMVGVGALIFHRDRILMAQRGKEPLKHWWSLPGGALELGESLADGVRREVREETGLKIRPLGVLEIFERIMRDATGKPEYHYVLIDYVCRIVGGELCAGDDVCAVEWVRRRDLQAMQITEGTLGVIEKGFRERRRYK